MSSRPIMITERGESGAGKTTLCRALDTIQSTPDSALRVRNASSERLLAALTGLASGDAIFNANLRSERSDEFKDGEAETKSSYSLARAQQTLLEMV